jgi:hypothetical protein
MPGKEKIWGAIHKAENYLKIKGENGQIVLKNKFSNFSFKLKLSQNL